MKINLFQRVNKSYFISFTINFFRNIESKGQMFKQIHFQKIGERLYFTKILSFQYFLYNYLLNTNLNREYKKR